MAAPDRSCRRSARAPSAGVLSLRSGCCVPRALDQRQGRPVLAIHHRGRCRIDGCPPRPGEGCATRDRCRAQHIWCRGRGGNALMTMNVGPAGSSRDPLRAIYEQKQKRPRRARILVGTAAIFVLGVFAIIIYYAYQQGRRAGTESVAPLIKAEQQPYKVKPDSPGGTDVPGQDKSIYSEVSPGVAGGNSPERLLPPAESPLPKPTESQPGTESSATAPSASPGANAGATPPAQTSPPGIVH